MPPKTPKAGGGAAKAKEEEVKALRGRFLELTRKYKEQEKLRGWLMYEVESSESKRNTLAETVVQSAHTHEIELGDIEQTVRRSLNDLESRHSGLTLNKKELQVDLAGEDVMDYENERLRDLVCQMQDLVDERREQITADLSRRRLISFKNRRVILKVQRDMIREVQERIRARAFGAMEKQAREASMVKRKLEEELMESSRAATIISERQDQKHRQLRRMRIYREALDETTTLQEKRVTTLEREQVAMKNRIEGIQQELRGLCEKVQEAKAHKEEQVVLAKRLKEVQAGWKKSEYQCSHFRNAAITTLKATMHSVRNRIWEERFMQQAAQEAKRPKVELSPHVKKELKDRRIFTVSGGPRKEMYEGYQGRASLQAYRASKSAGSTRPRHILLEGSLSMYSAPAAAAYKGEGKAWRGLDEEGSADETTLHKIWQSQVAEGEEDSTVHLSLA